MVVCCRVINCTQEYGTVQYKLATLNTKGYGGRKGQHQTSKDTVANGLASILKENDRRKVINDFLKAAEGVLRL
jgi:hypothetical protein